MSCLKGDTHWERARKDLFLSSSGVNFTNLLVQSTNVLVLVDWINQIPQQNCAQFNTTRSFTKLFWFTLWTVHREDQRKSTKAACKMMTKLTPKKKKKGNTNVDAAIERQKLFWVASVLPGGIRALSLSHSLDISFSFPFFSSFCDCCVGMANEIRPQCSNGDYLQQHQKGAGLLRVQLTLWKVNHFTPKHSVLILIKLCP